MVLELSYQFERSAFSSDKGWETYALKSRFVEWG